MNVSQSPFQYKYSYDYSSLFGNSTDSYFATDIIKILLTNGSDKFVHNPLDLSRTHFIHGLNGNDTIEGSEYVNEVFYGDEGDDHIFGNISNRDQGRGGLGDDTIVDCVQAWGGQGDDLIYVSESGSEAVTFFGMSGDDSLYGNEHSGDALYGGMGNDILYGWGGNDTLYGDWGHDVLNGADGDDVIHGGTGNDIILGGMGADTMNGGSGADHFVFGDYKEDTNSWQYFDTINDFQRGVDKIDLSHFNISYSDVRFTGIEPGHFAMYTDDRSLAVRVHTDVDAGFLHSSEFIF